MVFCTISLIYFNHFSGPFLSTSEALYMLTLQRVLFDPEYGRALGMPATEMKIAAQRVSADPCMPAG